MLLLDEPTDNLDADDGAQILRELLDRDGSLVDPSQSVALVTYQLPSDARLDRVVTVAEGPAEIDEVMDPGASLHAARHL
ncbi:hypothetical protein [Aldersonia kunmingensis]|uniref:hypothetical protein n=1 Tax=Aldersonia kunmingensis TaxID=408066 RepID=UPI0008320F55